MSCLTISFGVITIVSLSVNVHSEHVCSRFDFAFPFVSADTHNSIRFLEKAIPALSFPMQTIQSDNGAEFSRHFTERLLKRGLSHRHSRIRTPTDNGHLVRFNRTIQEESAHATPLYFEGEKEAAKKRLQKLRTTELITERPRRVFEPSVLFLTRKGLTLLQGQGVLAEYPAFDLPALDRRARVIELTLRHELEVMDVKAAFHSAIKNTRQFAVAEFSTWPLLYQFETFRTGNRWHTLLSVGWVCRVPFSGCSSDCGTDVVRGR